MNSNRMTQMTLEQDLVHAILGKDRASALDTDAYKMSMAQAGYPLRTESFYLSFRREGFWYNPFDLEEVVRLLRPELPTSKERGFLQAWGYGLTPAMEAALQGHLSVWSIPKGCWFGKNEPIVVLTGPSFLVSWYEPLLLMLHYTIQAATRSHSSFPLSYVPSEREALSRHYRTAVYEQATDVIESLLGDGGRAFEVGMRAATSIPQHRIALTACREAGIHRTSNLGLAYELNLIPVGTTGHEHQQRHGNDAVGFRAIRDSRPESPSYLFDTYDPIKLGIPAVQEVVREDPQRRFSVRFDSGNQTEQFRLLWDFVRQEAPKADANFIFEDGYTARATYENECRLAHADFSGDHALYGYGGFLVNPPDEQLTRDAVSAAYKLCESLGPKMKFSGTPGKMSLPGRIRSFAHNKTTTTRMIAQEGEDLPDGFGPITPATPPPETIFNSARTNEHISTLRLLYAFGGK